MSHYPPAFGRRMAWDVDGTVALWVPDNGVAVDLSPTEMVEINSEDGNYSSVMSPSATLGYLVHIFPELRDIDGYFAVARDTFASLEGSVDTTNGVDGTWINITSSLTDQLLTVRPNYRSAVNSVSATAVKGIRARKGGGGGQSNRLWAIHIYGKISSGQTPDRLLFLDPDAADAVFTRVLDFGDVPRGQTQSRNFKLRNNSGSLTVNTISITAEDIYLNAGDWYTFSEDNINFFATLAIGNLGPGADKLIYMRQVVPGAETLGLQTGRIRVSHASVT